MKKPSKKRVADAKREIVEEDLRMLQARAHSDRSNRDVIEENNRRSSLPSEDPEHVCGLLCDGQDGMNSHCARLRWKLFGDG